MFLYYRDMEREIARVSDNDINFPSNARLSEPRFEVRAIIMNPNGEICVIKSQKYDYIQLPGGGIELGETSTDAIIREIREETGYIAIDVKGLGYILDNRSGLSGKSYAFDVKISKEREDTNYTKREQGEDFKTVWLTRKKIIQILQAENEKLKTLPEEQKSYNGAFAAKRDLILVEKYLDLLG